MFTVVILFQAAFCIGPPMGVPAFFRWLLSIWPGTIEPMADDFDPDKGVHRRLAMKVRKETTVRVCCYKCLVICYFPGFVKRNKSDVRSPEVISLLNSISPFLFLAQ